MRKSTPQKRTPPTPRFYEGGPADGSEDAGTTDTGERSYSADAVSLADVANVPNVNDDRSFHPSGYSWNELSAFQEEGKGGMDLGTQTVDQALAAQTAHSTLNSWLSPSGIATLVGGPLAGAVVGGMQALASGASLGQVIGQVGSGLLSSALSKATGINIPATAVTAALQGEYGKAGLQTALSELAAATGVSTNTLTAMAQGQFGQAAANMALGGLTGKLAETVGVNPAFVGKVLNETGIAQQLGQPISEFVQSLAPELSQQVSQIYGNVVGLKGEGINLGQLGEFMGLAAGNSAISSASAGGDGTMSGIAAPSIAAAAANNPSTSGIAALAATYGLAGKVGGAIEAAKLEAARKEQEQSAGGVQLFSSDIFARPQSGYAGGGMVKKFAGGGDLNGDGVIDWEDDYLAMELDSNRDSIDSFYGGPGGISGITNPDPVWDGYSSPEAEAAARNRNASESRTVAADLDTPTLTKLFNSLTDAAKSLFMKSDGSGIDFAKLAAIGGGVLGYKSAKKQDLSGIGFQGQIPNLAAARAQVPYEYDEARRPGSYGRRYLSDMYYAKPEDAAKIRQQAIEQAQGIAALQRADGSMSTSIAPGGIGGAKPKPAPAPEAPTAPTAPEPLYKSLTASSTPEQIAAAYKQWAGGLGGDTEANRTEAARFLQNLGVNQQTINRAYDTYKGVPLDQYKGLTGRSSAKDIARAYNQWVGTTPDLGDVAANQQQATSYLKSLGLSDTAIQQAYEAYKNKQFAAGGIASLAKGGAARQPRYLDGATNGQADQIETTIDGEQPALLSHGEFVIPADIVSALGGGNSKAGAETLYDMMDRVRQQAFGRKKQMSLVDPNKVMPA